MYVFEIDNQAALKDVVLKNLKILGIRCRLPKKTKDNEKENVYTENQTFQKPIHLLKKCNANRLDGSAIEIPEFLVSTCSIIEKDITTEGIFRKAGSTCKQRESKLEINQGKAISCDFHVFDACNLVKLFFRELPQPLIPYSCHEIFLKCMSLSSYEKQVEALLLACLLLPMENLATLAFFMEFLQKVSQNSDRNKMDIKNLAIILTPTLMPVDDAPSRTHNSLKIREHFKVIEMLIENAEKIGIVPDSLEDSIISMDDKKRKKKRRSGSITRMFTGLKKMVGNRGSSTPEWDDSLLSNPGSCSSLGKRKALSTMSMSTLLAKKKRLAEVLPDGALPSTPLRCRMSGYYSTTDPKQGPLPANLMRAESGSPPRKSQRKLFSAKSGGEREAEEGKSTRGNLVRRRTTKKQASTASLKLGTASSTGNLFTKAPQKTSLERRLSIISWGKSKKASLSNLFLNKSGPEYLLEEETPLDNGVDLSDQDFVTVPKVEYEDIKNRVSALEEELEKLNTAQSVQTAYEQTLEESERINDRCSTENLASRLSRELKIRKSGENKVIRSPSARKIGSIRRRSKEFAIKSAEPKTNLKRGRPNTLQTGLPSPRSLRIVSDGDSSVENSKDEWKSGEVFFARENLLEKLLPSPSRRPSIAEIHFRNAGMVLEKAKLFNSLNQSGEMENKSNKIQRRQSVRLQHLKRMNDGERIPIKVGVTRTRSLEPNKNRKEFSKDPFIKKPEITQDLKETIYDVCTPLAQKIQTPKNNRIGTLKNESVKRQTPTIKKSLGTRSPRHFAKTPISQLHSNNNRNRATPMRALVDLSATPHRGLRRSPRILARSISSVSRHNV